MEYYYELFLSGCYNAVVRIDRENDDLYNFIELMKKLGWSKYTNYLEKINEESGLYHLFELNGGKGNMCLEFQMYKGFTFDSEDNYKKNCEETKVLSVRDLINATDYASEFGYDYKEITDLTSFNGGYDLDILNNFCEMYGWLPIVCSKGFNIFDTQFIDKFVDDKYYDTFNELVDRIVGRAIDYFKNEMEIETDNDLTYGYELLRVARKYCDFTDKYTEKWLNDFEKYLEETKNENK